MTKYNTQNLKPFKRPEDCTPEELKRQKEIQANATKAAVEAKTKAAQLKREMLDRNAIVDDALVDLLEDDPDAFKKMNHRLLSIINSDDAKDADVTKAIALFTEINQVKAAKTTEQRDLNKPKTSKERQEILRQSGVRVVTSGGKQDV